MVEITFWDFQMRQTDRPSMVYTSIGMVYDMLVVDEPTPRRTLAQYERGTAYDGSRDGWWLIEEDGSREGPYSDFAITAER